jgi:CHAT domain-containing protein
VRLSGRRATVEAVTAALGLADLAHIAADGIFRSDNPLFSHLQLADGPLTVYDLEQLPRAPRVLVLSACNSGLSGVRPGDELLGLSSALFSLGTATLVATVIPVPDESTRHLMLALHRQLRAGREPASALAEVQAAAAGNGDLLAQGFVCLGFG